MMTTQPFCPFMDRRVFIFGFPKIPLTIYALRESELPYSLTISLREEKNNEDDN